MWNFCLIIFAKNQSWPSVLITDFNTETWKSFILLIEIKFLFQNDNRVRMNKVKLI